jgi:hypothetical protein
MTDQKRKMQALARLAVRRQAQVDDAVYLVYLEDLEPFPVAVVERACHAIGTAERVEFETAFPPVGNLLAECKRAAHQIETERIKALVAAAPKLIGAPETEVQPPTREEAAAFVRDFKARVLAHRRS